jgi:hypothetical protein
MRMRAVVWSGLFLLLPGVVHGETVPAAHVRFDDAAARSAYAGIFGTPDALTPSPGELAPARLTPALNGRTAQSPAPVAVAQEYSHAYQVRLQIHKVSSFAMLPLFATQVVLGEKLYSEGGGSTKSAHAAVGASIGVLYGINTVTGVWNLWEGRKDPAGRTRRLVHSILMLAADTGFLATAATAPETGNSDQRSQHRAIAYTSMGIGTAGYLYMLFTR